MRTMTHRPTDQDPPRDPYRRPRGAVVYGVVAGLLSLIASGVAIFTFPRSAAPPAPAPMTVAPAGQAPAETAPPLVAVHQPQPDWPAAVTELLAYSAWLRVHPDASEATGLGVVMTTDNPAYAPAVLDMERLVSGALRYDPVPAVPQLSEATVLSEGDGTANLRVTFAAPQYRVVDRAGAVVVDSPARTVTAVWHLVYSGGQWRIGGTS